MRPGGLPLVGFALMMAILMSLGTWQLWRAEQRAATYGQFDRAGERPALTVPVGGDRFDEQRYRWLELRGQYLASRQVLLDSMIHEGRVGYHVLTPFRLARGEPWVLVNRGWVPAHPERRQLPNVEVDEGVRVIRARIDALPRPGLTFEDRRGSTGGWPLVALFPDFEELEARLESPLQPYQLLLSAEAPDGFVRAWQPRTMPPERHVGYAIQWYSLAAVLGVLGVVLWWRAPGN